MQDNNIHDFIKGVLKNMPADWLNLTTHRLDVYEEKKAKTQFLQQFEILFQDNISEHSALSDLPTAYDYIRLGHPLSSVLEWAIAKLHDVTPNQVISFSSRIAPVLAILRKNSLDGKDTQICYTGELPDCLDADLLHRVYGYRFDLMNVENAADEFNGTTVFFSQAANICQFKQHSACDFLINHDADLGSVIMVNGATNESYISEIQHVRRRETIAMTPANCLKALRQLIGKPSEERSGNHKDNKSLVLKSIREITDAKPDALVGSSGLSIQYAIMMGLVDHALETYPGKDIKFIVPPNCYGGTNDQARRVAACLEHVEIVDLPVDRDNNMVRSVDSILEETAKQDAVPYIIAEIPTNPRVQVPELRKLKEALEKERRTVSGAIAIDPVFILDQTFCPNVHFLGEDQILSSVRAISYVSGSKFPSGGKCTAGYCVANEKAAGLMTKIERHLMLCDNEATRLQYEILAQQMPSMNQRIQEAYQNTREFVNFIQETLPEAKINFVSEELAEKGFTPSVFSLDLPTKGNTPEEREAYKRALNLELITKMITEIPDESKYCVSYGQLKGCYWTIPATSTQGTTKEDDKDYIARVALSPDMNLDRHKKVFLAFGREL